MRGNAGEDLCAVLNVKKKRNFSGAILCADSLLNLPPLLLSLPALLPCTAALSFETSAPKIPTVHCGWNSPISSTLDRDGALASDRTVEQCDDAPR